jgi:potassium-transporting ATPase KdpC subunit
MIVFFSLSHGREREILRLMERLSMLAHLRPALVLLVLFTALTGLAYPLAITGVATYALPRQAGGGLIDKNGVVIGSALIGQPFTSDKYFQPRPSATSAADPADSTKTVDAPYNASASSGSNLGPTSKKLIDRVKADAEKVKADYNVSAVPADAVTTSASGLDPDISVAFATLQAGRVARARGVPVAKVTELVNKVTEERLFKVFGEPRVNVLKLNMALDALQ